MTGIHEVCFTAIILAFLTKGMCFTNMKRIQHVGTGNPVVTAMQDL
jgi:hypothetical protein